MTPSPSLRRPLASLPLLLAAALCAATAALGPLAAPRPALARDPSVKVSAPSQPVEIAAGGTGTATLRFEMPPGHHVYAENDLEYIPVSFSSKDPVVTIRQRRLPQPKPVKFESDARPIPVYEGGFDATLVLAAAADAPPGERRAALVVGWQACTDSFCEDPVQVAIEVPVRVLPPGARPDPSPAPPDPSSAGPERGAAGGSTEPKGPGDRSAAAAPPPAPKPWLWQVLAAFASGLLVTLTPCVYPLIPVTVSFFDQQGGGSRAKAAPLALAYAIGIVAMYAILGVVMARLGRDLGSILGNAYVAWGFAALFVLLALSMFGLYDIQLPSSVATRLQSGERSGIPGALFLGLTLGLVAAPCTGPVTGGLMLVVAQTGDVAFGLVAFGSFGLGLALPFAALGIFSGALSSMPRAGAWMESVKHVFGYALIAFAIFFAFVATGSKPLTFALAGAWLLCAGAAAAAVASVFARALGAALLAAGLYFLFGPYVIAEGGPIRPPGALFASRVRWLEDHDAALAQARAERRPAVVDFSARWCNACHELDLTTFREDAVLAELARFVAVKVDVTSDEKNQRLKTEVYKAFKIPFMAFYDSQGRQVASLPREGASGITTEDVLATLKETR